MKNDTSTEGRYFAKLKRYLREEQDPEAWRRARRLSKLKHRFGHRLDEAIADTAEKLALLQRIKREREKNADIR